MKYFRPKTFFIISAIFLIHIFITPHIVLADEILINSHIDTTLDPSITYLVEGDYYIYPDATLTIPAGTHIIFTPGSRMIVQGNLVTKGTTTKHVSMAGGPVPIFIPQTLAISKNIITSLDDPDTVTTQTTEVQSLEVAPMEVATPDVSSPEVSEFTVTNGVMQSAVADPTLTKHDGVVFWDHLTGTLAYTDISDGAVGINAEAATAITLNHVTFTNCNVGIQDGGGTLKLTSNSFINDPIPANLDIHTTFTHSNSVFTNDDIKGWQMDGDVLSGDTVKLNSIDGEYDVDGLQIVPNTTLTISPGVTLFTKDGPGLLVEGTLNAIGTTASPITIYGDGQCPLHQPSLSFYLATSVTMSHVNFHDLCDGMYVVHSTIKLSNDFFDTIAGPVVWSNDHSTINASNITMHDVYQAFDLSVNGGLTLSNATISVVNTKAPAIDIHNQTPFSGDTVSIDGASTCIGIIQNSSLTAKNFTLNHCSTAGITSDTNTLGSSGITLTDSEIMNSGTAMNLSNVLPGSITSNRFHDNKKGIVLTDMPKTVVINNWWGSNSGPTIADNPGGTGDSIITTNVPEVDYRPWIGMTTAVHNPIIIVPGITGTAINKDYGDKSELWPNITKLALSPTDSFLDDLELLQSGAQSIDRPMVTGDIIRSVATTDIFAGMIDTLTKDGYTEGTDLFVLPYDWRLSNDTNQSLLKDAVANALAKSGKTKVNIIAHSMGGLLVEDYLAQNPTAPIDHLFYIGVPHLGAPKTFQTLMYGDDMGFKFSIANAVHIPLLNADTVKTISQNMPSVYELLPSQKYIDTVGSYVTDHDQSTSPLSLDETEGLMINGGRNKKMFPFAKTLHDSIDNLDQSKFLTYDFAGCGSTKTVGGYNISKKELLSIAGIQLVPQYRLRYIAGDGVVPVNSANVAEGATNYYVASGSHGTLPAQATIQSSIVSILDGDTVDTTNGASDKISTCSLSGKIVEVHSPVSLDIYDDQGNHTGPTADGEIEYGVPNVDYEIIGDDKFTFLPTGPTYTIVNHAQAVGSYDMYVSDSAADDSISHQQYFHDIPLTTTNTTATFTITPNDNPTDVYTISADEDGDGEYESTFSPVSSVGQPQANDVTPPVTTASVDGNLLLSLTAQDDNAGVLNTQYSLDGTIWNTYTAPVKVLVGITIQFFSTDLVGNVEDIKSFVVPNDASSSTTQTTTTAPVTITPPTTPGNNYYYGGTTINTEPVTPTPTPVSDSDTMIQTAIPTTDDDTPTIPITTTATAQTSEHTPEVLGESTSDDTIENTALPPADSVSGTVAFNDTATDHTSPAEALLASVTTPIAMGKWTVLGIVFFGALLLVLIIRKIVVGKRINQRNNHGLE